MVTTALLLIYAGIGAASAAGSHLRNRRAPGDVSRVGRQQRGCCSFEGGADTGAAVAGGVTEPMSKLGDCQALCVDDSSCRKLDSFPRNLVQICSWPAQSPHDNLQCMSFGAKICMHHDLQPLGPIACPS